MPPQFIGATCKPISYDMCKAFVYQFDRLYKAQDGDANPMLRTPSSALPSVGSDAFFDSVQFPVSYNFPQNLTTGVPDRTFTDGFSPDSSWMVHNKIFHLVNPTTGKALTVQCSERTASWNAGVPRTGESLFWMGDTTRSLLCGLVQEDYARENAHQQFKLNGNDQLQSVGATGAAVITAMLPPAGGPLKCRGGVGLAAAPSGSNPLHPSSSNFDATRQQWRFYDNEISNNACGRSNGNYTITAVEDNSIKKIPYLEDVSFSFISRFNGQAIGASKLDPPLALQPYQEDDPNQRFRISRPPALEPRRGDCSRVDCDAEENLVHTEVPEDAFFIHPFVHWDQDRDEIGAFVADSQKMLGLRCKDGITEQTQPVGPGLFLQSQIFGKLGDKECRSRGCGLWWKFRSDGSIVNYLVGEGWSFISVSCLLIPFDQLPYVPSAPQLFRLG